MKKIVGKDKLIKYIKRQYGNFYTTEQIAKIIEEDGCSYFKELNIKYLNFGKWEITEN